MKRRLLGLAGLMSTACVHDPFGLLEEAYDWEVVSTEHFRYHYVDTDRAAYAQARSLLSDGAIFDPREHEVRDAIEVYTDEYEIWYGQLANVFGYDLPSPVAVYAFPSRAELHAYGNNHSAGAWIDSARPNGRGPAIYQAVPLIPHELVHQFQTTEVSPPLCLMEGLANAAAGSHRTFNEAREQLTIDQRPTLVGFSTDAQIPYESVSFADGSLYSFPIHRVAALKLGLETDPEYELADDQLWPGVRPHQVQTWGNVLTRDFDIPYTICASWVHYLVTTRGWPAIVQWSRRASTAAAISEDEEVAFLHVYGETQAAVEESWIHWLASQPAEHWDAPINPLPKSPD